jgi:predicted PurR-regulated permease PerM
METRNIFKATLVVLFTLLGAYILVIGLPIVVTLLVAIIIASAVRPVVNLLSRVMPEGFAIVLVYLLLALIILIMIFVLVPPMFNQLAVYIEQDWRLAYRLNYAQSIAENFINDFTNDDVSLVAPEQVSEAVEAAIAEFRAITPRLLQNIGNFVASGILIFVMGAYWLTSHLEAKRFILRLTTPAYRSQVRDVIYDIEYTLGSYVRGVITIASIVGILNFIPMQLLQVPNALALAFTIAILTIIPVVGGLIGGVIATLITLVTDPTSALMVFIIFFVVNQIENYILQPRIMSDEVGMNPLLIIVYTSVGFVLGGIVGTLLAIPIMGVIHILTENFIIQPYRSEIDDDKSDEDIIVELEKDQQLIIQSSGKPGQEE